MRPSPWLALITVLCCSTGAAAQGQKALPDGAVARLGTHRFLVNMAGFDNVCDVTPDGKTLVVVNRGREDFEQGDVVLYELATGLERKRLGIVKARSFAIARNVPRMLVFTASGFELWDLAKLQPLRYWPWRLVQPNTELLSISPCGNHFAASVDFWQTLSWSFGSVQTPMLVKGTYRKLTFSPDSSRLFGVKTNSDGYKSTLDVFEVKSGKLLTAWKYEDGLIDLSPCCTRLARGSHAKPVAVGDLDPAKKPDLVIPGEHGHFRFTPDGKQLLLCATYRQPANMWDLGQNKAVVTFREFNAPMFTFVPGSNLLVSVNTGVPPVYGVFNEQVHVWDWTTGKRVLPKDGHPYRVYGLAWSPDGTRLASCSHDTILIFDPATGKELLRWIGHEDAIKQVAFVPGGKILASASSDGSVAFWDPASGQELKRFHAKRAVESMAFTPDGKAVTAACADQMLITWELATGAVLRTQQFAQAKYRPVVAAAGQFAAGMPTYPHEPALLLSMHLPTGRALPPLSAGKSVLGFAFSPDGKLLATSNVTYDPAPEGFIPPHHHAVRVWETATRREILRCSSLPVGALLLAFSPDNRTLVYSVGHDVHSNLGRHGEALMFHDLSQARGAVLPKFGKGDGAIAACKKWMKDQRLLRLDSHHGTVTCLEFSPDGKLLATGGSDGVIHVWKVGHFVQRAALPAAQAKPAELWEQLADGDAGIAYRALAQLAAMPKEAVAFLDQHLEPAKPVDVAAIRKHIKDIDADSFALREKAKAWLVQHGDQALPFLTAELQGPISLEAKVRLEGVLERVELPYGQGAALRGYRCVVLLERIGTAEARALLTKLGQGAPEAWLTVEARHALEKK